ncbi:MAG: hypothetical protein H6825_06005 [Planctomycetes bacterium]|nr:hypothetical protein [Planctomycetota bacterium]
MQGPTPTLLPQTLGARAETSAGGTLETHTLWFVMNASAPTADLGLLADGSPSPLGTLWDTNIARFTPAHDASAAKVQSTPGLAAMTGDLDADGLFWESLGDDIDSLALSRRDPPKGALSIADFLISTETDVGDVLAVQGLDHEGALDGSVFRLRRSADGQHAEFAIFLPEILVIVATGQYVEIDADLDVDAFVQDADGALYLSFRADESVNGVLLADDGVVCIPAEAITYDESGDVAAVAPDSAVIVLDRARVDALVEHADLSLASGTAIHTLSDLQALELDPLGGSFEPVQPIPGRPEGCPHLLFNGQRLGATVLTTRDGGRIATLDGHPLGEHVVNGGPLGLQPALTQASTHDLNALCLSSEREPTPVVDVLHGEVESLTSLEPPTYFLGNFTPGGTAWLYASPFFLDPGDGLASVPAPPGSVQPDLYLPLPWIAILVPIDSTGRARVEIPVGTPPDDMWVVVQAWDLATTRLSPPAAVWVWK